MLFPHCPTFPFPPSEVGQEMSPAGFVPQHLILMEGQLWAQAQVTVTLCQHSLSQGH